MGLTWVRFPRQALTLQEILGVFKRKDWTMKLIWTELKPAEIEFRYYWTKENGWVEKQIPKQPIYILKESV